MAEQPIDITQINNREHIAPDKTGDNIAAKKVVNYAADTNFAWQRLPMPLIDAPYDNIHFSNADINGNYQTVVFKNGSATVRTLTLAFDGSSNVTDLTRA